jgi:hypothetical protein
VRESSNSFVELEQDFLSKPTEGWKLLRCWKEEDYSSFSSRAIDYLKSAQDSRFSRLVLLLIREEESELESLLFASEQLSLQESLHLATLASRVDPKLPPTWAQNLSHLIEQVSATKPVEGIARRLEILARCLDPLRAASLLGKMSSHSDPRIRSKAALLLLKVDPAADLLPLLEDENPRVRSNGLESMWGRQDASALDRFEQHSTRPHIRESVNALLGLHRAGQLAARRRLIESAETADTRHQLAAIWAMGQTQDPRLLAYLQQKLRDSSGPKHTSMLRAARRIKQFQAECAALPSLFLEPQNYQSLGLGRIELSLTLLNSNGLPVLPDQIFPTQFLLRYGGTILDHFQLKYQKADSRMDVAILAPKSSPRLQLRLQESLEMAFETRRSTDSWAVQAWPITPAADRNRPGSIEFSSSKPFQSYRFGSPENLVGKSFKSAVDRLMTAFPQGAASRHLILLTDPVMDVGLEPSREWAEEMRRFQITPHVLSLTEFTPAAWNSWKQLCHKAGGSCVSVDIHQLAQKLRQLCLSLQMRIDLTCSLGVAGPAPIESPTLQIEYISESGSARLNLDSSGNPAHQTA